MPKTIKTIKITRTSLLKVYGVSKEFIDKIRAQAAAGDPDWLLDIIQELDYIKPGNTFYIPEFHGPLQKHHLTSGNFDLDALGQELLLIQKKTLTKNIKP